MNVNIVKRQFRCIYGFVLTLLVMDAQTRKVDECYTKTRLDGIPKDHIYYKLLKPNQPIVIGYKGNIVDHQENTLEGMKSLVKIQAGGMHMQVRMTKDNKLILFGDDNLMRMTGEKYDVHKLPYSEIVKMPLMRTVKYPITTTISESMYYSSRPRVPLLEDVLREVKGKNLLIYIELVPGNVPPAGPLDRHRGLITSTLTANLVRKLNMQKEVIIVSRDAFKLKAVQHHAPELVSGWWMDKSLFSKQKGNALKKYYYEIPDILGSKCFTKIPNGTVFTEYVFQSGIVSKAVNASVVDLSIDLYKDKKLNKKLPIGLVVNSTYGHKVTLGAFAVYSRNMTEHAQKQKSNDVTYLQSAVDNGVTRFITDDVNRVKRAFHEKTIAVGAMLTSYYTLVVVTVLLGKALVTLLFV